MRLSEKIAIVGVSACLALLYVAVDVGPFKMGLVTGTSMNPTMKGMNVILAYRWGKPEVGDIVCLDDEIVTPRVHRIISMNRTHIIAKGDNDVVDDPWNVEDFEGTVIWWTNVVVFAMATCASLLIFVRVVLLLDERGQ